MGLLSFLKSLHGEGRVRIEFETDKETGYVKVPYTGSLGTITEKDFLQQVAGQLSVDGLEITKMRIVAVAGTTSEQPNWTYEWYTLSR